MDCRTFRKHHFAYLDDTLAGDVMTEAQQHIMRCDACAAHDTLVRRSIMMVRNLPEIEPSEEFSRRLQQRLASCKQDSMHDEFSDVAFDDAFLTASPGHPLQRGWRTTRTWFAVAACVTVVGAMAYEGDARIVQEVQLQPVLAAAPAPVEPLAPIVSPELLQAMATGNPMFSMAMLLEEAPAQFFAASSEFDLYDGADFER